VPADFLQARVNTKPIDFDERRTSQFRERARMSQASFGLRTIPVHKSLTPAIRRIRRARFYATLGHLARNQTREAIAVSADHWLSPRIRAAAIERTLKTGQSLFRMGDVPAGLFEVVKGKVRLVRTDASGRETVLYVAVAGNVVSEASLFSPVYHCNALASTPTVVRLYPKALLFAEFERTPETARAFMQMLAREIMSLRTRLEISNIQSARERVRYYLALNVAPDGRTVALSGTIKELAVHLGLSHEALYRTLAVMQEDGEIERGRGRIVFRRRV
jgi:CRP/FNR family transcriptional regulator, dissimilatory nitrate respiration regulator